MLRPRARVGRAQTLLPLSKRSAELVIGLLLGLLVVSGCGSGSDEEKSDEPSKAALDCRDEWKDLKARGQGPGLPDLSLGAGSQVERHPGRGGPLRSGSHRR